MNEIRFNRITCEYYTGISRKNLTVPAEEKKYA